MLFDQNAPLPFGSCTVPRIFYYVVCVFANLKTSKFQYLEGITCDDVVLQFIDLAQPASNSGATISELT